MHDTYFLTYLITPIKNKAKLALLFFELCQIRFRVEFYTRPWK